MVAVFAWDSKVSGVLASDMHGHVARHTNCRDIRNTVLPHTVTTPVVAGQSASFTGSSTVRVPGPSHRPQDTVNRTRQLVRP